MTVKIRKKHDCKKCKKRPCTCDLVISADKKKLKKFQEWEEAQKSLHGAELYYQVANEYNVKRREVEELAGESIEYYLVTAAPEEWKEEFESYLFADMSNRGNSRRIFAENQWDWADATAAELGLSIVLIEFTVAPETGVILREMEEYELNDSSNREYLVRNLWAESLSAIPCEKKRRDLSKKLKALYHMDCSMFDEDWKKLEKEIEDENRS